MYLKYDHSPSLPYIAGTEHVGLSPTRLTLALAPSAKRREAFGESHEWCVAFCHSYVTLFEADFGTSCVLSCIWGTASNNLIWGNLDQNSYQVRTL